jgi:hypothetical protein
VNVTNAEHIPADAPAVIAPNPKELPRRVLRRENKDIRIPCGGRLRSGLSRGVRPFREQAVAVHDRCGEIDEIAVVHRRPHASVELVALDARDLESGLVEGAPGPRAQPPIEEASRIEHGIRGNPVPVAFRVGAHAIGRACRSGSLPSAESGASADCGAVEP